MPDNPSCSAPCGSSYQAYHSSATATRFSVGELRLFWVLSDPWNWMWICIFAAALSMWPTATNRRWHWRRQNVSGAQGQFLIWLYLPSIIYTEAYKKQTHAPLFVHLFADIHCVRRGFRSLAGRNVLFKNVNCSAQQIKYCCPQIPVNGIF